MSKFMRCNMDAALFQVNARSETNIADARACHDPWDRQS